jgi:hypothetical protein
MLFPLQFFALPRAVLGPFSAQAVVFRDGTGAGDVTKALPARVYSRVELELHSGSDLARR